MAISLISYQSLDNDKHLQGKNDIVSSIIPPMKYIII